MSKNQNDYRYTDPSTVQGSLVGTMCTQCLSDASSRSYMIQDYLSYDTAVQPCRCPIKRWLTGYVEDWSRTCHVAHVVLTHIFRHRFRKQAKYHTALSNSQTYLHFSRLTFKVVHNVMSVVKMYQSINISNQPI